MSRRTKQAESRLLKNHGSVAMAVEYRPFFSLVCTLLSPWLDMVQSCPCLVMVNQAIPPRRHASSVCAEMKFPRE